MENLEVFKTKIGEIAGTYNDKPVLLNIYYGNYILPKVEGISLHLKEEAYRNILKDFLNSKLGEKYSFPEDEEIKEASKTVILKELGLDREEKKEEKNKKKIPLFILTGITIIQMSFSVYLLFRI